MSVSDFVYYVLRVPASLDGYVYMCRAIEYVLSHGGDSGFYEYLQGQCDKSYACIEKGLRLAKTKSLERISDEDYNKIFNIELKEDLKTKEFICCAAQYYRKEFACEG